MKKNFVQTLNSHSYISESQEGLQNCLNKTWEYCKSWGLEINYTKSKVMIFNKGSRLSNVKFYIDKTELEIVCHYKYLGIMLRCKFKRKLYSSST